MELVTGWILVFMTTTNTDRNSWYATSLICFIWLDNRNMALFVLFDDVSRLERLSLFLRRLQATSASPTYPGLHMQTIVL